MYSNRKVTNQRQLSGRQGNKKVKKSLPKRILKWTGIFLLSIIIICIAGIGAVYLKYKPMLDKARAEAFAKENQISTTTFKRAGSTIVLDKDGKQVAKVTGNDFKYDEISSISKDVQQGYIAIEDKDFLTEGGISYRGMARAAVEYVKNKGKVTQGGSTITQQLVKNVLLTQDVTMSRKLTEILLAPKVDKMYSKSEILEFYINNCYYGEGSYGIESASQHFFSKPASKLTLAESATLVGVSNNPTMFSPTNHPEASTRRRNIVLDAMLTQAKITQAQYDEAKGTKIALTIKKPEKIVESYVSSYAIDCTVRALMEQDGFKFQYLFDTDAKQKEYETAYREMYSQYDNKIRSGGYTIHTSIDMDKQDKLQTAVDKGVAEFTEKDPATGKYTMQSAAVSIDNSTGYVVAIVGGRGATDSFNRAFLSFRQPGSSIKPVLDYAPAFEQGYHPLQKITDEYIDKGPANDDYEYRGPVSIRYATEISINTVAYKVLSQIKPKTGLAYLESMRYAGLHPEDNNPIASIGGFTEGVSPVEQAGGYYALENKGYYVQPSCVTEVVYLDTEKVYTNDRQGKKVYTPETAYMMTDVLKGVINTDYGTGAGLKIDGQILAGKTGTTSDNKDGWFCGYSAYYTTTVWSGYDMPRTVHNLYGATYPGHIWQDYMANIHQGLPAKDFERPTGIVMKNINWKGDIVDWDSDVKDMFSQPLLDKQAEEAEQAKIKAAAAKQAEWDSHEPDRESNAERLVAVYESLSYTSRDVFDKVSKAYNSATAAIQVVDSKTINNDLTARLQTHHEFIEPQKQAIQAAIDKENADKAAEKAKADEEKAKADAIEKARVDAEKAKAEADAKTIALQQAELKAENDATNSVVALESMTKDTDKTVLTSAINDAKDKTALVADKTKHDELVTRINSMIDKLGMQ